ncbi:MAG: DUF948 domain-containing protein [Propionibacteriaceae bacterium]
MTFGGIAGLIAAIAFAILVILLAIPLLKLGRVLEEVRLTVRDLGHGVPELMTGLKGTIDATNGEIEKLGVITEDASRVTAHATVVSENAAQMATLFTATLGGPLVRTAAFSYGVRKAIRGTRGRRKNG